MFGDLGVLFVPTYSPKMSAKLQRSFENEASSFLLQNVIEKGRWAIFQSSVLFGYKFDQKLEMFVLETPWEFGAHLWRVSRYG